MEEDTAYSSRNQVVSTREMRYGTDSWKEHLTIPEAAGELRCSKAHVYNLVNGRVHGVPELPSIQLGRRKLVRRSTLVAWTSSLEKGMRTK